MSEGLMIGSECADWWQKKNEEYHAELEEYVLQNPSTFAILSCTAKATAFDFANVMIIDLARLGEGMAEGSFKGVVQDILELWHLSHQAKSFKDRENFFKQVKYFSVESLTG